MNDIEEIYNSLWGIKVADYELSKNQELLFYLVEKLKSIYNEIRLRVKEKIPKNDVSDTLITKILMGTFGCTPAYDRYFIVGIRDKNIATGRFNLKSILQLVEFYNKNYNSFERARRQMKIYNMEYPQMKILDSCFWQIGFDLDTNKGLKISH